MFNIGLIDSLKMRVKRDLIKIVDQTLIEPYYKFYPNLNAVDMFANDSEPFTKIINGITYRYYFKCYPNKQGYLEEYLVLQVSAKMLKEKYFQGITKQNYKSILTDINNQYVVFIPEYVFLDALVSDIDICINQLIDIKSYQTALSFLNGFPKPSAKPLMHYFTSKKQGNFINLGLDFNKRDKATNTKPYFKIYHKGLELQSKSAQFFGAFLQNTDYNRSKFLDNLVRAEFTIKAYDHKKYLTEQGLLLSPLKTFNDLINIPSSELTNIAKSGLNHYLEKPKKLIEIKGLTPMDNLMLDYMQQLIFFGADSDTLLNPLNKIVCPVTKSRMKSKVKLLLKHLQHDNDSIHQQLVKNKTSNTFIQNIGFTFNS